MLLPIKPTKTVLQQGLPSLLFGISQRENSKGRPWDHLNCLLLRCRVGQVPHGVHILFGGLASQRAKVAGRPGERRKERGDLELPPGVDLEIASERISSTNLPFGRGVETRGSPLFGSGGPFLGGEVAVDLHWKPLVWGWQNAHSWGITLGCPETYPRQIQLKSAITPFWSMSRKLVLARSL